MIILKKYIFLKLRSVLFFLVSTVVYAQQPLVPGGQEGLKSEVVETAAPQNSEKYKDQNFKDIARELRCPTCTGLSVLDSDAPFSVQIKDAVEKKMAEGKSKGEILDFFVQRYGAWILREPPKAGFSLIAWILPLMLLFIGPVILWLTILSRKKSTKEKLLKYEVDKDLILQEFESRISEARLRNEASP